MENSMTLKLDGTVFAHGREKAQLLNKSKRKPQ